MKNTLIMFLKNMKTNLHLECLIFILTTTEGVDIRIWAPVKSHSLHGISHGGMKKSVIVVQSELYNLIV